MAKTFSPVNDSPDQGFNGKYVDYAYSDAQKEKITEREGTHFFDATIIPTVQYQVYGLDNVWFWDNEGQNYTYNKTNSQIEVKAATPTIVTTLSFEAYTEFAEGDTVKGVIENMTASTEVPAGAAIGDIYADKEASESGISYFKVKGTESQDYEEYSNYEFNKYGKVNNNTSVIVMTDGIGNVGTFDALERNYKKVNQDIPIYSIQFASADQSQLRLMAQLSNGKVFDGTRSLVDAFMEVRGYN
jgi:hypothetical protein